MVAVLDAPVFPVRTLAEELVDARRALEVGEAEWLEKLADFDRGNRWAGSGQFSTTEWLTEHCRMAHSTAWEKLRVAHELARRPQIAAAFATGELSYSHVRLITRIDDPGHEIDGTLVDLARHGSVRHLERAIRHYQLLREQEVPPGPDAGRGGHINRSNRG